MNYAVFDCETTGTGSNDEVVQFSALLLNDDMRLERVYNQYCYTQVPFNNEASKVTGLNASLVHKLSNGKFFEDFYYSSELFKIKDIVWCGWNVNFDKNIINSTLKHNGLSPHNFGTEIKRLDKKEGSYVFDVMKLYSALKGVTYNKKLSSCIEDMKYSQEKLNSMYKKLLRIARVDSDVRFHNALYDSMVTWLFLEANRKRCI